MLLHATLLLAVASHVVVGSWQYLSRPDLHVPVLNITHTPSDANKLAPGSLFIAPFSGSNDHDEAAQPHQPGPYIFNATSGELVWSGFAQYFAGWTVNLQKAEYKDQDVLFAFEGKHNAAHGHGHGHLTILDSSYQQLATVRAGHHRFIDKHEGQLINNGKSALVQIYHPVPIENLARLAGGSESDKRAASREWVVDAQFQEIDVDSGKVIFEWSSLDHVPVHHSNISLAGGQAGDGTSSQQAWDYFHINSVDKNQEGDYLISARDANSVYKISGKSGEIIWALGGRNHHNRDFVHKDDKVAFSYQHHARFHGYDSKGRELISLYDNSGHGTETDEGSVVKDAKTSSGKIIALDQSKGIKGEWTAETVAAFYPPFGLLSKSQGSTHILPQGNALVNWGSEGAVTEFTAEGEVLWHAFIGSGKQAGHSRVQNYRAFKFEWKGTPKEEPAVVGLLYRSARRQVKLLPYDSRPYYTSRDAKVKLLVAASWNGDTEVKRWRFEGRSASEERIIGQNNRDGFETTILVDVQEDIEQVRAIGLGQDDALLVTSRWEKIERNRPVPPHYRVIDSATRAFVVQS